MMMRKLRGLRLGRRRIVRIWRWVLRRTPEKYLTRFRARPEYESKSNCRTAAKVTKKLLEWGRCLTHRLRLRLGGGYYRLGDQTLGGDLPLLEEEEGSRPPPKGHLAVYVGGRKEGGPPQRYLVPVIYFNHPLFGELLREAEAEFGFHHPGGITIPCPVSRFERVQTRIAAGEICRKGARQNWR